MKFDWVMFGMILAGMIISNLVMLFMLAVTGRLKK